MHLVFMHPGGTYSTDGDVVSPAQLSNNYSRNGQLYFCPIKEVIFITRKV